MKKAIKGVLESLLGFYKYQRLIEIKNTLLNSKEKRYKEKALQNMSGFYSTFLSNGDLCFDVGANMGNRVEAFLKIGSRVIAIEPQDKCCVYLSGKFGNKITIVQKGCGAQEEEKEFFVSDSSTISSFSEEWIKKMKDGRFKGYTWNKTEKIKLTTLDALIKQFGSPKFIKIDVEGFEPEVLKGLSSKIPYISFEYAEPEQHLNTKSCIQQLMNINPAVKFNYSILETMKLDRTEWLSGEEMLAFIETKTFFDTGFGDIYVKN